MTAAAAPRPRPQSNGVREELSRIEAASSPWWAALPSVASKCAAAVIAPFRLVVLAAEAVVAVTFAGAIAVAAAWWTGRISDQAVAEVMGAVGKRLLSIAQSSGVI